MEHWELVQGSGPVGSFLGLDTRAALEGRQHPGARVMGLGMLVRISGSGSIFLSAYSKSATY